MIDFLKIDQLCDVNLRFLPGPQQVPRGLQVETVRQLGPVSLSQEAAGDYVVHFGTGFHRTVK